MKDRSRVILVEQILYLRKTMILRFFLENKCDLYTMKCKLIMTSYFVGHSKCGKGIHTKQTCTEAYMLDCFLYMYKYVIKCTCILN